MEKPLLSVITITYGHEHFLSKCIDGVLMQEGNFNLEFIIGNDKSPDNTTRIVQNYIDNHPKGNLIKFINRTENVGIMPNFYDSLTQATGDYVALCDGDDYWTDTHKLQKQLDFLESNKDHILVGHNVEIFENETNTVLNSSFPFSENVLVDSNSIYEKNYIPALSLLYRNSHPIPKWILNSPIGDYPLILFLSQFGKIGFINDVMASYRSNSGYHSSTQKEKRYKMQLDSLRETQKHLKISKQQHQLLNYQCLLLEQEISNTKLNFQKILKSDISFKSKVKLALKTLKN